MMCMELSFTLAVVLTSLFTYHGVNSQPPPVNEFAAFCNEVATSGNSPNAFMELLCRQLAETIITEAPGASVVINVSNAYNTTEVRDTDMTMNTQFSPSLSRESNATVQEPNSALQYPLTDNITDVKDNNTSSFPRELSANERKKITVLNDTVFNISADLEFRSEENRSRTASTETDGFVSDIGNQLLHLSGPNLSWALGEPVGQQRAFREVNQTLLSNANETVIVSEKVNQTLLDSHRMQNSSNENETVVDVSGTPNITGFQTLETNFSKVKRGDIMPVVLNGTVYSSNKSINLSNELSEPVGQQRAFGEVDQTLSSNADETIIVSVKENQTMFDSHIKQNSSNVNETVVDISRTPNVTGFRTLETNFSEAKRGDITPVLLNETVYSSNKSNNFSNETFNNGSSTNQVPITSTLTELTPGSTLQSDLPEVNVDNMGILKSDDKANEQNTNSTFIGAYLQSELNTNKSHHVSDTSLKSKNSTVQVSRTVTSNSSITIHREETNAEGLSSTASGTLPEIQVFNDSVLAENSSDSVVTPEFDISIVTNENGGHGLTLSNSTTNGSGGFILPQHTIEAHNEKTGNDDILRSQNVIGSIASNGNSSNFEPVADAGQRNNNTIEKKQQTIPPVQQLEAGNEGAKEGNEVSLIKQNKTSLTAGIKEERTNINKEITVESAATNTVQIENGVLHDMANNVSTSVSDGVIKNNELSFTANTEKNGTNNPEKDMVNETINQIPTVTTEYVSQAAFDELSNQSISVNFDLPDSTTSQFTENKQIQDGTQSGNNGTLKTLSRTHTSESEQRVYLQGTTPVPQFTSSQVSRNQQGQVQSEGKNQETSDNAFDGRVPVSEFSRDENVDATISIDQVPEHTVSVSTEGNKTGFSSVVPELTTGSNIDVNQSNAFSTSRKQDQATVTPSAEIPQGFAPSISTDSQAGQKTELSELFMAFLVRVANVHCEQSQQEFWKNVSVILQRVASSSELSLDDVTRSVTDIIESYRRDSPFWSTVATKLQEATSEGQWRQLLHQLLLKYSGNTASQLRLLTAARTLRGAVRAAVSSPECRTTGLQPARDSCDAFVLCYRAGWMWRAQELPCPRGSAFSSSQRRCVWRPLADCHRNPQDDDDDDDDSASDSDSSDSDSFESEEAPWPLRFGHKLLRMLGLRRS